MIYRDSRLRAGGTRLGGIVAVLVVVWLIVGVVAAGQRHYFDSAPRNCASGGTIALTIIAGPLNYSGANPRVNNCDVKLPQPSQ
ncbi:hypothetical protein [Nocardia aurantiaca]|uniref:hypothetical protein n=1 Tax=Nocardia aurantiaca TaxID=2675850 RepID=UPI001E436DE3|nr:hypothetical protein [Nocardia aurantiaca]